MHICMYAHLYIYVHAFFPVRAMAKLQGSPSLALAMLAGGPRYHIGGRGEPNADVRGPKKKREEARECL